MFERMKPTLKTYKCELGACALFVSCGGALGIRGDKLVEVAKQTEGLIISREEYYNCTRFELAQKNKPGLETKEGD